LYVTDGDMPFMKHRWVPGLHIGYEHTFVHQIADLLDDLALGKPTAPTFRDVLATQAVCDSAPSTRPNIRSGRRWCGSDDRQKGTIHETEATNGRLPERLERRE